MGETLRIYRINPSLSLKRIKGMLDMLFSLVLLPLWSAPQSHPIPDGTELLQVQLTVLNGPFRGVRGQAPYEACYADLISDLGMPR